MAVVESAYGSLVQGVSQQHPAAQQPGQVQGMLNMLCDPVTGPRRRPGAQLVATLGSPGYIRAHQVRCWVAEIGGTDHLIVLYPGVAAGMNGTVIVYSMDFKEQARFTDDYLGALDTANIDIATLRGDLWILNRERKPALQKDAPSASRPNPAQCGFFWVKSAAFSKTYTVSIKAHVADGDVAVPHEFSYTTPDGTHDGDADKATPSAIVGGLFAAIQAFDWGGVTFNEAAVTGAFAALHSNSVVSLQVQQRTGDTYMGASGHMNFRTVSELPSSMASAQSQSWTVSVGTTNENLQYYRWDNATGTWIECPQWGTEGQLLYMPRRLRYNTAGQIEFQSPRFEARLAGDDENNPLPAFLTEGFGLTGIASYQGRLVLMAGNRVNLSDSENATLFTRTTVTSIVDSDCIEIGSGSLNSATFRYATQYNKDLILWSGAHQAVLPGGGAVLTPRSAYLVSTGTAVVNLGVEPQAVGRWLLYSSPSALACYGFGGLYPSDYAASQYILAPLTEHLPTYFDRPPSFFVSAGNTGMAVCGSGDGGLWVYQYLWQGNQLVQSAWHRWEFHVAVENAFFYRDALYLLFNDGANLRVGRIEYRRWDTLPQGGHLDNPFLDLAEQLQWNGAVWAKPHSAAAVIRGNYALACRSGHSTDAAGEPLAVTDTPDLNLLDGVNCEPGMYWVGQLFSSTLTPTPPVVKDQQGRAQGEDNTRLLSYKLQLRNSGEVTCRVTDLDQIRPDYPVNTVRWAGKELQLMRSLVTANSTVQCPVHVLARNSNVTFASLSTRELNLVNLTYKLRLGRNPRRI